MKLVEIDASHIAVVKKIKSRIIMKDGNKIMGIAERVRELKPEVKLSLIISGPICGKTRKYLEGNGVEVKEEV
jgi:hypothetical protein